MTPTPPARRIVVVGGGTAGWLSAAHLATGLPGVLEDGDADITVVAASGDEPIGVGEATVPSIRATLAFLGIEERDLAESADATVKEGIDFVDWTTPGERYLHPFVGGEHAFHLDTARFAAMLRATARRRGVRHVDDRVVRVDRSGDRIEGVTTSRGELLTADLFLDCTGFQRVLIGDDGWRSFADALPCDRAVVQRFRRSGPPRTRTTATAHDAGWTWRIDLGRATSIGVVHSSAHLPADAALVLLADARPAGTEPLHDPVAIEFSSGRLTEPWRGNVVAVGLAAGFVEPLESTGIFLVEDALNRLAADFPRVGSDGPAAGFNEGMGRRTDTIRDFLVAHYATSPRPGAFWDQVRAATRSPWLDDRLARWRHHPPATADLADADSFVPVESWQAVLGGMGWGPARRISPAR